MNENGRKKKQLKKQVKKLKEGWIQKVKEKRK